MLFSIITIGLNSEKEIRRTIEAVLAQTLSGFEYIIKDGGSTDATVAIAEEYREQFEKKGCSYRIISEPDKGLYDAMNTGIKEANGELIGLINAGDWYEPDALQKVAEVYAEEPFDLFYADIKLIKANGTVIVKHSKYDRFPSSRHWNHPSTFIRNSVYKECGLYRNENIYDDYDLILRIRRAGKKVVVRNVILANFTMGGISNTKSLSLFWARLKNRYANYRNNGYSRLYIIESLMMEAAKFVLC